MHTGENNSNFFHVNTEEDLLLVVNNYQLLTLLLRQKSCNCNEEFYENIS